MSGNEEKNAYEKLTPQRKLLYDAVMQNLEKGSLEWLQGWAANDTPVSAITGKRYNGLNRLSLMQAAAERGYSDNRWLTYKQMEDRGWSFKHNEEGKSLGKNAGVSIEYFELRDKKTKQPFDRSLLDGMTADERDEYIEENVYPLRKYYRVFNGDVIEGIPALERRELDESGYNERAENLIKTWSDTECPIIHGGSLAYYNIANDEIRLPRRESFVDLPEYYSTALHEIGHSTGAEKRLNREMSADKSSQAYAMEELRAEFASMFIEQDLGVNAKANHTQNNSAYIQSWSKSLKEDPNVLFKVIVDAERITKFVTSKEKAAKKEQEENKHVEYFAIMQDTDEYGDTVNKVMMCVESGKTQYALSGYPFRSREALMTEFGKMQELPLWKDKEFQEVSEEQLKNISAQRAEEQSAKSERLDKIQEEESSIYIPPGEAVAKDLPTYSVVDMAGRGIDSLVNMDDRDIVERASKSRHGDKFLSLWNGEKVLGTEEKNERSLMARLAIYTQDKDKLLRIFKASGQFRDEKPNAYYNKLADESIAFIAGTRSQNKPAAVKPTAKTGRYANAKS